MIEINLLPQELKVNDTKKSFDTRKLVHAIPLFIALLLVLHIYLGIFNIFLINNYNTYKARWTKLEPQIKALEASDKQKALQSQDAQVIRNYVKDRVSWAKKLNTLSLQLPPGIWFDEIIVINKEFILKATVVSLERQEMNLINKFLNTLKEGSEFSNDFKNLELGSLTRRTISGYDTISFSISGLLK